jgi:acyl-CoA thioester hydrolase
MPRVKIDLPTAFPFSTEIPVRITDVNYGGHLGNDSLLSLLHEARVRYLHTFGWSEKDIAGAGIIMTDAAVVYRSEAFHGDRLRIEVAVTDIQPATCDLVYRVTNAATGTEIARAKTGIAFFDYAKRNVVPMPDAFRKTMHVEIA